MGYQRRILSDDEPVAMGSITPLPIAGDTSDSLDVWNYRDVEFFIKITDRQTATSLSITVEYSSISSVSAEDWSDLTSESISSGAATQSIYSADFDISGESGAFTISISVPTRGRYMRFTATPDAEIASATYTAIRRV